MPGRWATLKPNRSSTSLKGITVIEAPIDRDPCPACESNQLQPVKMYNNYLLLKCSECSFIYTEKRLIPADDYEDAYDAAGMYAFMVRAAQKTATGEWGVKKLWWFKRLALRWIRTIEATSLMDIGCGPGTFMLIAQRLGLTVEGIEPTRAAAETARSLDLRVHCGYVEEYVANGGDRTFDIVTCFEVLEHVPDPVGTLTCTHDLVDANGHLILSVPNVDDPYMLEQPFPQSIPPIHINFFSRKSMAAVLHKSGFVIERVFTLPIPTGTVSRVYGKTGLLIRLPYLVMLRLLGKADGSSLVVMARKNTTGSV